MHPSERESKTRSIWFNEQRCTKLDAQTGEAVGPPIEGVGRIVAISEDGMLIVSGDDDCIARLRDASRGEPIDELTEGHSGRLRAIESGMTVRLPSRVHRIKLSIGIPIVNYSSIVALAIRMDGSVIM